VWSVHNLYSVLNIVRWFKSSRLRWLVHDMHVEEKRYSHKFLVEKPKGKTACKT